MDLIRLLERPPLHAGDEAFATLLSTPELRVVRIVSNQHASSPHRWYDQDEHEWVTLLTGEAELTIEGRGLIRLWAGDALLLPRRTKHRLERTSSDAVWLAVFFKGEIPAHLPAATAERILEHMNDDHADALLDYARAFGAVTDATSARMTGIDATGFNLDAETPSGARQLRLPFDPPVDGASAAREALVAMAKEARRAR
jgi:cupin 2 domain-containing protein